MIKAVIFDIGGVLLDMERFVEENAKHLHYGDKKALWEDINILAIPICDGSMGLDEFWEIMSKKYGKQADANALKRIWVDDYVKFVHVKEDMVSLVRELKNKYRMGIISNTNKIHADAIRPLHLFELFDAVILSHEARMSKDKKEIFNLAAKTLNVKPEECVFIDDISKFVEMSRSIGMTGIQYKSTELLREDLRKLKLI